MIQTDGSENLHQNLLNGVGGVVSSAHACLENHCVTLFLCKIQKTKRRLDLESGRCAKAVPVHGFRSLPDLRDQPCQRLFLYVCSIHLDPLPVGKQRRRDIASHPVSALREHRGQEGQNRTFSVGPRDVDDLQSLFWIPKAFQKLPHGIQAKYTSVFSHIV